MCEDFGSSLNALPDGEIGLITNVCRSTETPEVYMFVMVWRSAAPLHGTSTYAVCMVRVPTRYAWYAYLSGMHGTTTCAVCMVRVSALYAWYKYEYLRGMHGTSTYAVCISTSALSFTIQFPIIVYWLKRAEAKKNMKSTKNLCLFFTTCRCRDPLWISGHWTDSLQMIIGSVNF